MAIRPVILCGGSGTRLWPDSRKKFPKQFMPVLNSNSLFELTIKRIQKINNILDPIIITNKDYKFLVSDALAKLKIKASILLEPVGKNTTAAIYIIAKLLNNDDDLIIFPSDHFIKNESKFIEYIDQIFEQKNNSDWFTLGITPTYPSTSYGYIKLSKLNKNKLFSRVEEFVEKPNIKNAKNFFDNKSYFWNSGIFIGNTKMIIKSIRKKAALVSNQCDLALKTKTYSTNENEITFDFKVFNKIPSISIDVSVMEKSNNVYCCPIDCEWSDVGSWDSFAKSFPNKKRSARIVQIASKNNFIKGNNRLIATIGVEDLIVVDNSDAILITKKGVEEKMRDLISILSSKNLNELNENLFENRPWGKFENLFISKQFKIKKITVNPKSRLSKQYHNHRSEHWFIIEGKASIYKDGCIKILTKGQSIDIPKKSIHFVENKTDNLLTFIEIQIGSYFGEDDIIRIEDKYGRE